MVLRIFACLGGECNERDVAYERFASPPLFILYMILNAHTRASVHVCVGGGRRAIHTCVICKSSSSSENIAVLVGTPCLVRPNGRRRL